MDAIIGLAIIPLLASSFGLVIPVIWLVSFMLPIKKVEIFISFFILFFFLWFSWILRFLSDHFKIIIITTKHSNNRTKLLSYLTKKALKITKVKQEVGNVSKIVNIMFSLKIMTKIISFLSLVFATISVDICHL